MGGLEKRVNRDAALDFTKGMLVLFMILYHWTNYFVGTEGAVYTYLRFITPSFIFIAGFLIAHVYPRKYGLHDPQLYRRLFNRGLKLLTLFTLLNVSANLLFSTGYRGAMPGTSGFFRNAFPVYVSGNAKAAFGILVPISYLLLLSPGVLFLSGRISQPRYLVSVVLFLFLAFLDYSYLASSNLTYVAIGLFGMACGFSSLEKIGNWKGWPYALWSSYFGYLLYITIWGVGYLSQIVGVCLSVGLIYMMGLGATTGGRLYGQVVLLGEYSLLGYIAQIGVLHAIYHGLRLLDLHVWVWWTVSFAGAFALTMAAVNVVEWSRSRSTAINRLYGLTFS